MIHIPRLVGVNHGGPNQGLFNISEMKTEPSDELIGEIKKLRRGSKIGIEFAEELPIDKIVIDGETIDGTTTGMHYWNAIIEACQRYGKEVCFLGDFDTYKNIWTLIHRELKIKQRILELGIDSPEAQPLFAERYAAQVLAEHAMVIGQDEALLKNIERYLPRIVIVGDAHANYFAAAQDQNGLSVGCYDREDVDEYNVAIAIYDNPDALFFGLSRTFQNAYKRNAKPNRDFLLLREHITRQHRAVITGRALMNGKPDYIGTWDQEVPAHGLFEVYIDGRNGNEGFHGHVEDAYGQAGVTGHTTEDAISFTKTYSRGAKRLGGASNPIFYVANATPDGYKGSFTFDDGGQMVTKDFTMKKSN